MITYLTDDPAIEKPVAPTAKFGSATEPKHNRELAAARRELQRQQEINRSLLGAVHEGLRLRSIWTAINDPLALNMERDKLRTQFKQIELTMRAAIEKAEEK